MENVRFALIDVDRDLHEYMIQNVLTPQGYTEVDGETGGDNDYLCVDMDKKQWCWCENGSDIFNEPSLEKYQTNNTITLSELIDLNS